jgi:DNA polymerase-1
MGHRRRKYLVTPETLGDAERQAMNSPIQSLASDMTMLAIIELDKILRERSLGHILFFVHDSIAFEIKKERLEEGAAVIKQTMEHALDFIQKPDFYVPFPVDIEYGRGWGELQKLKIDD